MKPLFLPDGTWLPIPDEATPEQEKGYLRKAAEQFPEAFPSKSPSVDAWNTLKRGGRQTWSLLADVAPAMAAKVLGNEDYYREQMAEAAAVQEDIKNKYPAKYQGIESIMDPTLGGSVVGRAAGWLGEGFLENLPSMVPSFVTGGAGQVAAGVGRGAALKALGTGASEAAVKAAVTQPWMKAMEWGSPAVGAAMVNIPESYQNIKDDTNKEDVVGTALVTGAVKSALDSILPAAVLNKVMQTGTADVVARALSKKAIDKAAEKSGDGFWKGLAKEFGKGVAIEGSTEGTQEALDILGSKFVDDTFEIINQKNLYRVLESAIIGGLTGGVFGGGAHVTDRARRGLEPGMQEYERQKEQKELEQKGIAHPADQMMQLDKIYAALGIAAPTDTSTPYNPNISLETLSKAFEESGYAKNQPDIQEKFKGLYGTDTEVTYDELVKRFAAANEAYNKANEEAIKKNKNLASKAMGDFGGGFMNQLQKRVNALRPAAPAPTPAPAPTGTPAPTKTETTETAEQAFVNFLKGTPGLGVINKKTGEIKKRTSLPAFMQDRIARAVEAAIAAGTTPEQATGHLYDSLTEKDFGETFGKDAKAYETYRGLFDSSKGDLAASRDLLNKAYIAALNEAYAKKAEVDKTTKEAEKVDEAPEGVKPVKEDDVPFSIIPVTPEDEQISKVVADKVNAELEKGFNHPDILARRAAFEQETGKSTTTNGRPNENFETVLNQWREDLLLNAIKNEATGTKEDQGIIRREAARELGSRALEMVEDVQPEKEAAATKKLTDTIKESGLELEQKDIRIDPAIRAEELYSHYKNLKRLLKSVEDAEYRVRQAERAHIYKGKFATPAELEAAKEAYTDANKAFHDYVGKYEGEFRKWKPILSRSNVSALLQPNTKVGTLHAKSFARLDDYFGKLRSVADELKAVREGKDIPTKEATKGKKFESLSEKDMDFIRDKVATREGKISTTFLTRISGIEAPQEGKYTSYQEDQQHPFTKLLQSLEESGHLKVTSTKEGNISYEKVPQKHGLNLTDEQLKERYSPDKLDIASGPRIAENYPENKAGTRLWNSFAAAIRGDWGKTSNMFTAALDDHLRRVFRKDSANPDFVSAASMGIMLKLHQWKGDEPLSHWVNRIARNVATDFNKEENNYLKREASRDEATLNEEEEVGISAAQLQQDAEATQTFLQEESKEDISKGGLGFINDLYAVMRVLQGGKEALLKYSGPDLRRLKAAAENLRSGAYGAYSNPNPTNFEFKDALDKAEFGKQGMDGATFLKVVRDTLPENYKWVWKYIDPVLKLTGLDKVKVVQRTVATDRAILDKAERVFVGSYYHPGTDTIYLAESDFANPEVGLHEIIHAATLKLVNHVKGGDVGKAVAHLNVLRNAIRSYFDKQGILKAHAHALSNVNELLTAIFTNESFRRALEQTPPQLVKSLSTDKTWMAKAKDMLRHIWHTIREMLGIPVKQETAFEELLGGAKDFMTAAYVYRNYDMLPNSHWGGAPAWSITSTASTIEDVRKDVTGNKYIAQGKATMKALMSGKFVDRVPPSVAAFLYRMLSIPQISMWGKNLFVNRAEYGIREDQLYKWRLMDKDADLLASFVDNTRRLQGMSQQLRNDTSELTDRLRTWKNTMPEMYSGIQELMFDSSQYFVNPTRTWEETYKRLMGDTPNPNRKFMVGKKELTVDDLKKLHKEYSQKYESLVASNKEAATMWSAIQNYYSGIREEILRSIYKAVYDSEETPEAGQAKMLETRARLEFGTPDAPKMQVDPYIRFVRSGEFYLHTVFKDGEEAYTAFPTRDAAERAMDRLQEHFGEDVESQAVETRANHLNKFITVSRTFLDELLKSLYESEGFKRATDVQKEEMKNLLYDTYMQTLPEVSIAKAMSKRKGYTGFERDLITSVQDYGSRVVQQLPRIRYGSQMELDFKRMESLFKYVDGQVYTKTGEEREKFRGLANRMDAYLKVLELHMKDSRDGTPNQMVRTAQMMSWYFYLAASPAAASLQLLQTAFITFPFLVGRYGLKNAMSVMSNSASDYFSGRLFHKDGKRNVVDGLYSLTASPNLTEVERKAANEFILRNTFNEDEAYELTQRMTEELAGSKLDRIHRSVKHLARYMFHNAERFNREISAMSAFRLEYDRLRKQGVDEEEAYRKALDKGTEVVSLTHGDYTYLMAPAVFKGNTLLQIALIFKKFPQMMAFLMADMTKRASKTISSDAALKERYGLKDSEIAEFRSEARKQLAGVLGFSFFAAGLAGNPLFGAIKVIAELIMGDDDEPYDFDLEMRKLMPEIIFRGPLNAITGIDFAQRLELSNMWWRDPKMGQDRSKLQAMLEVFGGPFAGIGINMDTGFNLIKRGHMERGMEMFMPLAMRNAMKAYRFSIEDATNVNGARIKEINGAEVLVQLFGYTPAELARTYRENTWKLQLDRGLQERHTRLLTELNLAAMAHDDEKYADVLEKMREFGAKYPAHAFSAKTLVRSRKEFFRRRLVEGMNQGTYVDPKKWPLIKQHVEEAMEN